MRGPACRRAPRIAPAVALWAALAAALGWGGSACSGRLLAGRSGDPGRTPGWETGAPRRSELALGDPVPVVIARAEGVAELALLEEGRGVRTFLRAGDLVLASDGATGEALVARGSGTGGVGHDRQRYSGGMVVSARPGGGLRLTNRVELEDYVEGVVAAELSLWSAEPAELEAQAVAVRTYALFTLGRRRAQRGPQATFLWDSVEDQAYRGRPQVASSPGGRDAQRRLRAALEATRGLLLVRDGRLVDARYCAACGGHTADLGAVFEGAPPGARGVICDPCAERAAGAPGSSGQPSLLWEHTFDAPTLARAAAGLGVGAPMTALTPVRTDGAGRWLAVRVEGPAGSRTVDLDDLRRALGFDLMKSAWVTSTWPRPGEPITSGLLVRGVGRGHGVGLCQEGARGYARRGWSARAILAHYYPGSQLQRLPR